MDSQEYMHNVRRTNSRSFYGNDIPAAQFMAAVRLIVAFGKEADGLKKHLFYGQGATTRTLPEPSMVDLARDMHLLESTANEDYVHGVVGVLTEVCELYENLRRRWENDRPNIEDLRALDLNVEEEVGDILWYLSIILDSVGSDFETAMRKNIAKLSARYPERFANDRAETRDLLKEIEAMQQVEAGAAARRHKLKMQAEEDAKKDPA